jgi:hypothetical protein
VVDVQPGFPSLTTTAPLNVSTANVLRVSDAYACVRVLADGISTLPLHVYRRTEQGRVPAVYRRTEQGRVPARDNARAVQLLSKPAPVEPNATHVPTRRGHGAEPSWLRNRPQ